MSDDRKSYELIRPAKFDAGGGNIRYGVVKSGGLRTASGSWSNYAANGFPDHYIVNERGGDGSGSSTTDLYITNAARGKVLGAIGTIVAEGGLIGFFAGDGKAKVETTHPVTGHLVLGVADGVPVLCDVTGAAGYQVFAADSGAAQTVIDDVRFRI
jgi:hypothetical protein